MTKSNSKKRSFGERVNTWVQTIGIVIAAIWAAWAFIYKEITVPKTAPVNITLNLQVKKIGVGPAKGNLTAVELKATATNPSLREIHLLPSAWVAYGSSITAAETDETDFSKDAVSTLRDTNSVYTMQRHAKQGRNSIVALGRLFGDEVLEPSETIGRTVLFYIPKDNYDLINLIAMMPSAPDVSRIQFEWTLNGQILEANVFRVNEKGERIAVRKDQEGSYGKDLQIEQTEANAEISLWP
jgi:hypothetical protein